MYTIHQSSSYTMFYLFASVNDYQWDIIGTTKSFVLHWMIQEYTHVWQKIRLVQQKKISKSIFSVCCFLLGMEQKINVEFSVPPAILNNGPMINEVTKLKGESLVLTCLLHAVPLPTIVWTKNDQILSDFERFWNQQRLQNVHFLFVIIEYQLEIRIWSYTSKISLWSIVVGINVMRKT